MPFRLTLSLHPVSTGITETVNLKGRLLFCLWLIFTFFAFEAFAQDNTDFVQFFVNSASLNPSYTGVDGQPALYLGYRRQWVGVPDGPQLSQVSLQGMLSKKLSGGVTLVDNSRGLLSTSMAMFTGGYYVQLAEEKMLRFGLSVGTAWNRVNTAGVVNADPNDPALLNAVSNNFFVQGNAGVSYHSKSFHVGLALPQLFQPSYASVEAFNLTKVSPFQSVVVHASNRFYFNKNKNVFEPFAIYRYNQAGNSQYEIAALVHLQNQVWAGASYRQGLGASALAGIKLNKLLALGYSFSMGVSKTNQIVKPSHEIHLALLFGKRHKDAVGIYSFVNTDKEKKKKTPAQLAAERKAKQEELAKKYKDTNVHNQQKPAQKQPETKKEPVVVQQQPQPEKTQPTPQTKEQPTQVQVQPQPKKDSVVMVVPTPQPERHEFVRRAHNKNDLESGTYIIVGAFRSEANAKKFRSELVNMEYADADYGFISARNLWYVFLGYDKDVNAARTLRDKFRQEDVFKDAWILTVE